MMKPVVKIQILDEETGKTYEFLCSKQKENGPDWRVRCEELDIDETLLVFGRDLHDAIYGRLLEKKKAEHRVKEEKEGEKEPQIFPELHDMREAPWPEGAKRGDEWYTVQVFVCDVCGGKTNRVIMGGWPGTGPRRICPNASKEWHWKMEDKYEHLKTSGHPNSYYQELEQELEALREKYRDGVKDEIRGEPDFSQIDAKTGAAQAARIHR